MIKIIEMVNESKRENESKVYSSSKKSLSSLVVNILTEHCSLKCSSLDQIGILNSRASAKKGISDLCEISFEAFNRELCEGFFNSIKLDINSKLEIN